MPSRWERGLRRFKDVEVPTDAIEHRMQQGSTSPDEAEPQPTGRGRVVSAVVAFAIFATAISAFVIPALRGSDRPTDGASTAATSSITLDPASICNVPTLDPSVSLLVGEESTQYPNAVLEGHGQTASALDGQGTDELRLYIASSAGRNFPATGWRVIAASGNRVTFAAPHTEGVHDWWVVGFSRRDGSWHRVDAEIAQQEQTPAQKGQGLSLHWTGEVVVRDGGWVSPIELVNGRSTTWTDHGAYGGYWGLAHVFDPTTGEEIGSAAYWPTDPWQQISLEPNQTKKLPLALGGSLDGLHPGTYPVVACVPPLGLASTVATVSVAENFATAGIHVLTYESNGTSMTALGGGVLATKNGCLGWGNPGHFTYLIFPIGYQVVERDGNDLLIGPTGNAVAAIGRRASFGGGYVPIDASKAHIIGAMPAACIDAHSGYWLVGG